MFLVSKKQTRFAYESNPYFKWLNHNHNLLLMLVLVIMLNFESIRFVEYYRCFPCLFIKLLSRKPTYWLSEWIAYSKTSTEVFACSKRLTTQSNHNHPVSGKLVHTRLNTAVFILLLLTQLHSMHFIKYWLQNYNNPSIYQ